MKNNIDIHLLKKLPFREQVEISENIFRKDFSETEKANIQKKLIAEFSKLKQQGTRNDLTCGGHQPQVGRITELIGKIFKEGRNKVEERQQVVEFGNDKLIQEMDKTGNVNKVYQKVKREKRINEQAELGKTVKETPAILYNDDFNNIKLEENSIDLIITDPPYPKEYLHCWKELADYASKVLKPGGFLVAYSGQLYMKEVMNYLSDKLEYYWTFCLYHKGGTQIVSARNITCRWKPIFIYQKCPFKKNRVMEDYIISEQREKGEHEWQQSESGAKELIERFSNVGDTVLDPFMGAGTFPFVATELKRKAIGIEIDKKYYLISKTRYDKTRI